MQPVRHPARRQPLVRAGFTLIELLVVMVVIAILVALLFPAIAGAIRTAREATVVAEIATFDKAMVDFKSRYGVEVPSFIVIYEQGDDGSMSPADPGWGADTGNSISPIVSDDAYRRTSRAFIRQVWPDYDFSLNQDFNGNGAIDPEPVILDGSECLVFFLGGVMTRGALAGFVDDTPVGFAANGQNPFDNASTNNRIGPFVDNFLGDRFTDVDGDGMPEYKDGLSGQQLPYIYLSSYGGGGYKPFGLDGDMNTLEDNEIPTDRSGTPTRLIDDAYFKSAGPPKTYLNPQSYQLISPGSDVEFGIGGLYNGSGVPTGRPDERDNIANFKGGRLN